MKYATGHKARAQPSAPPSATAARCDPTAVDHAQQTTSQAVTGHAIACAATTDGWCVVWWCVCGGVWWWWWVAVVVVGGWCGWVGGWVGGWGARAALSGGFFWSVLQCPAILGRHKQALVQGGARRPQDADGWQLVHDRIVTKCQVPAKTPGV